MDDLEGIVCQALADGGDGGGAGGNEDGGAGAGGKAARKRKLISDDAVVASAEVLRQGLARASPFHRKPQRRGPCNRCVGAGGATHVDPAPPLHH